jgi:hypothetical protein
MGFRPAPHVLGRGGTVLKALVWHLDGKPLRSAPEDRPAVLASHGLPARVWHLGGVDSAAAGRGVWAELTRHRMWHLGGTQPSGAAERADVWHLGGTTPPEPCRILCGGRVAFRVAANGARPSVLGPTSPPQAQHISPWHLDGTSWHLGGPPEKAPPTESMVSGTYPVALGRPLQIKNQLPLPTSSPPKCHVDRRRCLGQVSTGLRGTIAERFGR